MSPLGKFAFVFVGGGMVFIISFLIWGPPYKSGSSHWSESQIFHSNDIQQELLCDSTGRILAAVQPDDGGSWVLYGSQRIAEGVYVDMDSAKNAGEKLRFDCPAIPNH